APRHEVWHPVPGLRAGELRDDWLEPAGTDAGTGGVRVVRHSGVDRRRGAGHFLSRGHSGVGRPAGRPDWRAYGDGVALVPALLGAEYFHHLSRDGSAAGG